MSMINRIVALIVAIFLAASLWQACNKVPHGDENYQNYLKYLESPSDTSMGYIFSPRISISQLDSTDSASTLDSNLPHILTGYMDISAGPDAFRPHDTTLAVVIDRVILDHYESGPKSYLFGDTPVAITISLLPIRVPFLSEQLSRVPSMPVFSYNISFIDTLADSVISQRIIKHNMAIYGDVYVYYSTTNLFSPTTEIGYYLADTCDVTIRIYNVLGNAVDSFFYENQPPGGYAKGWDATYLPSGIYFYKVEYCGMSRTEKMVLLK